ncbi:amino acid ABC transporter substrate-binding protein (PAAT family) [Ilumatobacter fluminis]|uniref:Amino acid ABC transporter substrate-binding protein (PAAT family) n=1 Tax=Ilumatobacter fluminis TaxID=467091 RepID=A0A4R7I4D2_9ACTN|nr:amino acid ABC transporter substrate-binding protein [Ilumatobacter fluminis]TDT17556.1 amino acid ABC transporter substrate-binding protein (PAAT family) [Ilumatobacter fluminis]
MTRTVTTKRWKFAAGLAAVALVAGACGGDDDDADDGDDDVATDDSAADSDDSSDDSGDDSTDDTVEVTQDGSVLAAVQDRGTLVCGGNNGLAGFGSIDAATGEASGFDIDFCRALAAAVLGDSEAIEIKALEAAERFPTLQSGEIDVLIRNTTRTASRDGAEQATFLHTTFYDGQGFMVPADTGFTTLEDLAGATVCVQTGTTTLTNLNAVSTDRGLNMTALEFESNDQLNPAFQAGQCEAWTSDASQLASFAAGMEMETTILPEIISKEPLGPAVADGDSQWAQVVDWATMATIQAWEYGIDSTNVDDFLTSEDSNILTFLGQPVTDADGNEAVKDLGLGLPNDFAYQVIKQVGNYQEIFEANLAPIGLTLEGSPNDLWTNGGLQYVPPFR